MKRKIKKKYHQNDSDSESNAPLVDYQGSSKSSLYRYSVEKCDFCDKIFNNKFNMLVHNAKHIIIPLINQKLYECTQCKRFFNTVESLEWHSINSHSFISKNKDYLPKILQSFVKKQPVTMLTKEPLIDLSLHNVNFKESPGITSHVPDLLESFVKNQPVTMLTKLPDPPFKTEHILESFVKREPIMLLNNESFLNGNLHKIETYSDTDRNGPSDSDDSGDENDVGDDNGASDIDDIIEIESETDFEYINLDNEKKIKDRLLFEDDETFHDPRDLREALSNRKKNTIILGNKPKVQCEVNSENNDEFQSVHYDELKRPGVYRCKKCSKVFPSKFDAIIHETDHLKFKRRIPFICRYCDWAVGNNVAALRNHKKRKHPDKDCIKTHKEFTKCFECGLRYINNARHRQNYHQEYACKYCQDVFVCQGDLDEHKVEHTKSDNEWSIKTVKVCDFCFGWFRDKINLKYKHIKNYYKLGERIQCERCEKYCFELRIVRMRWKKRRDPMKERIHYEAKKKKPKTNTDRLKNVQQRLKKLKKLNKF